MRPWSPAVRALLSAPGLQYTSTARIAGLYDGAGYFQLAAHCWTVYLRTDGTVRLNTRPWVRTTNEAVVVHTFLTLHEAYLTGMLLFPEDFLPIGH